MRNNKISFNTGNTENIRQNNGKKKIYLIAMHIKNGNNLKP